MNCEKTGPHCGQCVPHYHCGQCIHFAHGKPCKRLDPETIRFAVPWFRCYDQHQFEGIVCRDFVPKPTKQSESWTNFDEYWKRYVEQWLPYGNENINVYFNLHGNTEVRYGVPLADYMNGTMIDGDTLKAVEKRYMKRVKDDCFGWTEVCERINGVEIV
jgi:hypothetical protein